MYWLIALLHLLIMIVAAFHALIYKRDHRAALGWIGVIIVFPIAGPLLYFLFGINRLRTKARVFTGHHLPVLHFSYDPIENPPEQPVDPLVDQASLPPLANVGGRAAGTPLVADNYVKVLKNGDEFFPRLAEVIDNARDYVLLSTYLFSPKGAVAEVVAAMQRAARRGVKLRVLIDGVGVCYSLGAVVRPLREAGAEVTLFRPISLLPLSFDINLRNHRKIAVIDGHIGFFGGINIDPRHMVTAAENRTPTEDLQFEASGSVVAKLQELFEKDWQLMNRKGLDLGLGQNEDNATVAARHKGPTVCRVIGDGPANNRNPLAKTLHGVFSAAQKNITIMTPYFLPGHSMVAALQAATLRGVRVQILLPERSNLRFVDWATRNMLWELLMWNVEVYYKPAPFAHTKLTLVDDEYVMGGSANLDARSLRLNFELGVEMFDRDLATQVQQHVQDAIAHSRRVTLIELDQRPIPQRVRDSFFWLFSGYL